MLIKLVFTINIFLIFLICESFCNQCSTKGQVPLRMEENCKEQQQAESSDQSFITRLSECKLSPECGEGPYFIEEDLFRSNLIEDRQGIPLNVTMNLIDVRTCEPITGAKVYIWQPDYAGIYSGFMDKPQIKRERMLPKDSRRFLRGTQVTNDNGTVHFETLFPGHYPGRTPHIHFRVHAKGNIAHIGQIFFEESVIKSIHSKNPYNKIETRRLKNEEDGEFHYFNGFKSIIKISPASDNEQLSGIMNVVINPLHNSKLFWA